MLETAGIECDAALLGGWQARVERVRHRMGWEAPGISARRHQRGVSLALAAPYDQLFVATEVNEWALCAALFERDPRRWSTLEQALAMSAAEDASDPECFIPPVLEESAALARFEQLAAAEARPDLRALIERAAARSLPHVLDEAILTLGAGVGGRDFSLIELPAVGDVPWEELRGIPTVLVTGSNGKTTTVRVLAACARNHGWVTAYSSTDGVYVDGDCRLRGDYSGPAGARWVMRERDAQAAIVETARGGILRRGIAISCAQVALVTNVSSDHFGEYGIDDLDGLADTKLSVATVVSPNGMLVLNADDPLLLSKATGLVRRFERAIRLGWFALDADLPALHDHRAAGAPTCGVRDGHLRLSCNGAEYDLGSVAAMPLTYEASVVYNIANLAGAAVAAIALGIPAATIAMTFGRFGSDTTDNFGRMMRFDVGGVHVLLDYAHNSDGLRGLLSFAAKLRGARGGRLGLLLGHAGNRQDAQIEELTCVAASFRPDLVVVKENEDHLRGRAEGEVPRIIRSGLLRCGLSESTLLLRMSELEAARSALEWSRPGDVLVMPVHSPKARLAVVDLLKDYGNGAATPFSVPVP